MATQEDVQNISCKAGADLSAVSNLYKFVEGGQDSVTIANAATDTITGVLQSLNPQGYVVAVAYRGLPKVRASAAFAVGAFLTSAADGRAVAAATGNRYRAVAMEAALAANDLVTVRLVDGNNLIAP
jgi:hypothetical protein